MPPIIVLPGPHKRNILIAFVAGVGVGIFLTFSFNYFAIGPRPPTAAAEPAQR